MDEKEKLIILFHLQRRNGNATFLHPFENPAALLEIDDSTVIEGKYGHEPNMEGITRLRQEFYHLIDSAVTCWVRENRFPVRFLWTLGVFLSSYGFFTLFGRDLLNIGFPRIDEMVLALILSGCFYYILKQKDLNSPAASKRKEYLKDRIDNCTFYPDHFVREVEELLHNYESGDYEAILQVLRNTELKQSLERAPEDNGIKDKQSNKEFSAGHEGALSLAESSTGQALLSYLQKRFSHRAYRKQERIINRLLRGPSGSFFAEYSKRSQEDALQALAGKIRSGDLELALFITYCRLKNLISV